jgi:hypothetical protein
MLTIKNNAFLRYVLFADAATSLIVGVPMSVASGFVAGMTELPQNLIFFAGLSLFPFAASLIYLATRAEFTASAVWVVIIVNILWSSASILLIAAGFTSPNAFGTFFVIFQAIGVAAYAVLEYIGLRNAAAGSEPVTA